MIRQLFINAWVNLKFYRRNRLLGIIILVLFLFFGLSAIGLTIVLMTAGQKFDVLRQLYSQASGFVILITALLGLLSMHYHISNRCLKIVYTKPCSPETWLLSQYIAAAMVSLALFLIIFLLALGFFALWDIPIQWGLVYVTLDSFLQCMLTFVYITFLAIFLHPIIAGIIVLLFRSEMLFFFILSTDAAIHSVDHLLLKGLLGAIRYLLYAFYMVLPSIEPYKNQTASIYQSYHASVSDLKYFSCSILYTLLFSLFLCLLSSYLMKRKRYI